MQESDFSDDSDGNHPRARNSRANRNRNDEDSDDSYDYRNRSTRNRKGYRNADSDENFDNGNRRNVSSTEALPREQSSRPSNDRNDRKHYVAENSNDNQNIRNSSERLSGESYANSRTNDSRGSTDRGFTPKTLPAKQPNNVSASRSRQNNIQQSSSAWSDVPTQSNGWIEKENNIPKDTISSTSGWTSAKLTNNTQQNNNRNHNDNYHAIQSPTSREVEYSDEEDDSNKDFYVDSNKKTPYPPASHPTTGTSSGPRHVDRNITEVVDMTKETAANVTPRKTGRYDVESNISEDHGRGNAGNNGRSHLSLGSYDMRSVNSLISNDQAPTDLGSDIGDADGDDIIKNANSFTNRKSTSIPNRNASSVPFVLQAHESGGLTDLVQCVIIRDRDGVQSKLYPTYRLYLEDKNKLILLARKMTYNRTSNYHLFDMTRGIAGLNLTKKSGNYLGKLRAMDANKTEYTVVTKNEQRREELAAIQFDKYGILNQLREGCQPRKMKVLLPPLDVNSEPIPHVVGDDGVSVIDMLHDNETSRMFLLTSKDPVFENGNYRLNFHGRVSVPSVKNFQLSSPDDPGHVLCQFGKVGEDRFHLDFKAPLSAFQAFSLALCHFNI